MVEALTARPQADLVWRVLRIGLDVVMGWYWAFIPCKVGDKIGMRPA
jgi:hypothetical protein